MLRSDVLGEEVERGGIGDKSFSDLGCYRLLAYKAMLQACLL